MGENTVVYCRLAPITTSSSQPRHIYRLFFTPVVVPLPSADAALKAQNELLSAANEEGQRRMKAVAEAYESEKTKVAELTASLAARDSATGKADTSALEAQVASLRADLEQSHAGIETMEQQVTEMKASAAQGHVSMIRAFRGAIRNRIQHGVTLGMCFHGLTCAILLQPLVFQAENHDALSAATARVAELEAEVAALKAGDAAPTDEVAALNTLVSALEGELEAVQSVSTPGPLPLCHPWLSQLPISIYYCSTCTPTSNPSIPSYVGWLVTFPLTYICV